MTNHVLAPTRATYDGMFYRKCSCGFITAKCRRKEDATRAGQNHRRAAVNKLSE